MWEICPKTTKEKTLENRPIITKTLTYVGSGLVKSSHITVKPHLAANP